jgi:hypothetical protein
METDITKLGVLCILETHSWGASKRIPIEKINKNEKLSKWIRANKGLIDKEALATINSKIGEAVNLVKNNALPFPIRGVNFIPKDLIIEISEKLNNMMIELNELINNFAEKYDEYVNAAKIELADFFNEEDYPQDIKSKFGLNYRFLELSVPGEVNKISPKLYKEEMDKFKNMMEQARHEGILFLREGFATVISSIVNSITGVSTGESKGIRKESVEKVENFFEEFKNKNIFKDDELLQLIENARNAMFGVSSKDINQSEGLRKHITKEMEKVKDELEKSITSYKRKIIL